MHLVHKNTLRNGDSKATIDLRQKLQQLLMLISARCLLGNEVWEKMFDEVFFAFHEFTENSLQLTDQLAASICPSANLTPQQAAC